MSSNKRRLPDNIARGLAKNVTVDAVNTTNDPENGNILVYVNGEFEYQAQSSGTNFVDLWDANLNSPEIISSTGTAGDFYIVSVAGNTEIDGISTWEVNDRIQFNGTVWQRVPALQVYNNPIELTGNQVITQINTIYLINAVTADATITIPDADSTNGGQAVQILKNSGDFNVIVQTTSNQDIGISSTQTISQAGKGFTAVSRGVSNSWVINQDSRSSINVQNKNSNYTVTNNDNTSYMLADGTFTITLPTTVSSGFRIKIKNIGTGIITLSSSVNIDDETTKNISVQYDAYELIYDGVQWWIY